MLIDNKGFVRAGTDEGDSCHRTFSVWFLLFMAGRFLGQKELPPSIPKELAPPSRFSEFEVINGRYVRSPGNNDWTSDPHTESRDQLTPVMCFLASKANMEFDEGREQYRLHYGWRLNRLALGVLKRGFFAQNDHDSDSGKWKVPDLITPDLLAVMARGYLHTAWAPLALLAIILGDTFLVLNALAKVFIPRTQDGTLKMKWNDLDSVDDMNIVNVLIITQLICQTPMSFLARKIYKHFRKENYGTTVKGETSNVMGALAWYNRNDNPEITELYRPFVEKF